MQQSNSVGTMFDILAQALRPSNAMMKLSAIWSNKVRFAPDDEISIDEKGKPVKLTVRPTHKILSCWGKLDDSCHEIKAQDIATEEIITITL